MKREYIATFLLLLLVIFVFLQLLNEFIFYDPDDYSLSINKNNMPQETHNFNISRAFFITLNEQDTLPMLKQSNKYLHIENNYIFQAINGTQALEKGTEKLSLYTRYLMMISGRHDHMQLSSPPMLGCLLSHINIWDMIQPGETVAIFEEDAYFDHSSTDRIIALSKDMRNYPDWDLLMLMSGQFINSGTWQNVGQHAATCANHSLPYSFSFVFSSTTTTDHENEQMIKQNSHNNIIPKSFINNDDQTIPNICSWFGTRGYLITYQGARKLLRHAYPIQVQIDALMGLVAAFEPDFKMFWSKQNIVHQRIFYISKIWDACLKCYLPTNIFFYLLFILVFIYMIYSFNKCKSFS